MENKDLFNIYIGNNTHICVASSKCATCEWDDVGLYAEVSVHMPLQRLFTRAHIQSNWTEEFKWFGRQELEVKYS